MDQDQPASLSVAKSLDEGAREPWAVIAATVRALEATDLWPGPDVDALFGSLVRAVQDLPAGHPGIEQVGPRVRALCARGEGQLEAWWARRVVARPAAVRDFPYLANYAALARGEWAAITGVLGRRPRRVAFVGCGPLPLTALSWCRLAPQVALTCVDRDAAALALGREVASALGLGGSAPAFVQAEAAELDAGAFDAVVLAALVGENSCEKRVLVDALAAQLRHDAVLGVRSVPADGRQLLYPRLPAADLPDGVHLLAEWVPPPDVINSLLLVRRRPHGRWCAT